MSRTHLAIAISGLALCAVAVMGPGEPAVAAGRTDSLTGTVVFKGKAPARKNLDRESDGFCAKTPMKSDEVIVTNGKLKDVHVRIKSGTAGAFKFDAAAAVITQKDCMYRPHVLGIVASQSVWITNDDNTMHNVHGRDSDGTWFNRPQVAGAKAIKRTDTTNKAGEVLELKCDVHPWMRAYLPVTDHPYFDVTGSDGKFVIDNVPTGKSYTLEAWHPKYGLKTKTVKPGSAVTFQFP